MSNDNIEEKYRSLESSQKQHHDVMLHQELIGTAVESAEFNLFALLKPKLFRDGNQWCVLFGEDLQVGIAGFGDTPIKAIWAWNSAWQAEIPPIGAQ